MRPTLLHLLLTLLAVLRIVDATSTTLQQPTCDDTRTPARALFHTSARARACVHALTNHQADLAAAQSAHVAYVDAVEEFERQYDRLCRWTRLIKFPPPMTIKHDEAFEPVRRAWESLTLMGKRLGRGDADVKKAGGRGAEAGSEA